MNLRKISCPCSNGEESYSIQTIYYLLYIIYLLYISLDLAKTEKQLGVVTKETVARVGGKFLRADVKGIKHPTEFFKNQIKDLDLQGEG